MNQVHYEQVDKLTSKVLDEIASSSEISELERLICSNPNLRKRYSHLILQESLLHWETSDGTNFAEEEVIKPKLISLSPVASINARSSNFRWMVAQCKFQTQRWFFY